MAKQKRTSNRAFSNPRASNSVTKYEIGGDEYEPFGIKKADVVFVQSREKYDENQLGLFATPRGLQLAFAYENFGDVSLYLKGNEKKIYRFRETKVSFLGVVIGKQISFDGTVGGQNETIK